jgi:hypothetical protein
MLRLLVTLLAQWRCGIGQQTLAQPLLAAMSPLTLETRGYHPHSAPTALAAPPH